MSNGISGGTWKLFAVKKGSVRGRGAMAALIAAAVAGTMAGQVRATTLYWDINQAAADAGALTGNWDGVTANFNTDSTGLAGGSTTAVTTAGDDVVFTSGTTYAAGAVTLSTGRVVSSLTFSRAVVTTLTGGDLTIGGTGASSGISVTSAVNNAINIASNVAISSAVSAVNISTAGGSSSGLNLTGTFTGSASTGNDTVNIGSTSNGGITMGGLISDGVAGGKVALNITNTSGGATNISGVGNTYSGGTTINSGSVTATSVNAFGNGPVTVGTGSANVTLTINGNLNETITIGGTGTVAFASPNANTTFFGGLVLANNLVMNFAGTNRNTIFTGGVTGTGNLLIQGGSNSNGGAVFSGTNAVNMVGNITLNNGTTVFNTSATLGAPIGSNVKDISAIGTGNVILSGSSVANSGNITFSNSNSTSGASTVTLSAAAINNTGAILNNGTSTGTTTISGAIGTAVMSITENSATSQMVLSSGSSTYTAPTTVTSGRLTATNLAALGQTSGLSIGSGGRFDNTAVGTLNIGSAGTLTIGSGGAVGVGLTSTINVPGAVTANGAVNLALVGTPTATTYTVLTAPGGGLTSGGASYFLLNPTNYSFTINATDTAVSVTTTAPGAGLTGPAYFQGGLVGNTGNWSVSNGTVSNWTTDLAGTVGTPLVPGATTDVVLSTTSASLPDQGNMYLGSDMSVRTITANGSNASAVALNNVGSVYTLTIAGDGTNGITVASGSGAVTINPFVTVGGTQAWLNNGSNALTLNNNIAIGTSTLTLGGTGAGAIVINAPIAGTTGKLIINSAGSVTLGGTGTSTFTGGVTLTAGTLNINNASSAGSGTFVINGGTIDNTTAAAITTGNNVMTWGGDFAFTGTQSLNLGTGAVTMTGSRIITANANTLTVGGVISDGGSAFSLTKTGAGQLTINGANTYTGATNINAGTLTIGSGTTFANTSLIGLTGTGRLDVNVKDQSLAKLVLGGGVAAGTFLRLSQTQTAAGAGNGPGTIFGTLELNVTGANPNYTGGLTFDAGSGLTSTVTAALATPLNLIGGGNTTFFTNAATMTLTGGVTGTGNLTVNANLTNLLTVSTAALAFTGNLVLNNNGGTANTVTISAGVNNMGTVTNTGVGMGNVLISGVIGTAVMGVVQNSATSPLTLSGANLFTSGLTIKRGTVLAAVSNATTISGAGGPSTVGITLGDPAGGAASLLTGGTFTVSNPINLAVGAVGPLTIGENNTTGVATFSGPISLNGNNLFVSSAGTTAGLILSGGITGTGNVTVNHLASSGTLGITTTPIANTGDLTINTAGTGTLTLSSGFTNVGNITINSLANQTVNITTNPINNKGTITNSGTSANNFTFANTSDVGSNVTHIIQNTPGQMIFDQAKTFSFTGTVDVQKGTLFINFNTHIPGMTGITLAPGTTLKLDSNGVADAMGTSLLTINGGLITKSSGSGTSGYTLSGINVNGDFAFQTSAGTNLNLNGNWTFSNSVTITSNNTNTQFSNFNGTLNQSGVGGYAITKAGPGYLNYTNNSGTPGNFTGSFVISAGTLQITGSSVLTAANEVSIASGAALNMTRSVTLAGLDDGIGGPGNTTISNSGGVSSVLTLGGSGSYSYTGPITEALGAGVIVQHTGAGTQVLGGNNVFGGNVSVTNGTLRATHNNALGFGATVATVATATVDGTTAAAALDLANGITVNKPVVLNGSGNGASLINSVVGTTSVLDNGVAGLLITAAPTDLAAGTTVSFAGAGGAAATVRLGVTAQTFSIAGGTTVYSAAPTVAISGGGGAGATATAILSGGTSGTVTGITITAPGSGFTSVPAIAFTGGTVSTAGVDPTGTGVDNNFTLTQFTQTAAGTGYTSAPAVNFSSGSTGTVSSVVTGLALNGTNNNIGGAGNLTVNGVVGGVGGGFNKIGNGTVSLSAANTYDSRTAVSGGTLLVSNTSGSATGTGNVTMDGGTLGGTGTILGTVSAGTGAHTILPSATLTGTSTAKLTMGGLTTSVNTTLAFKLVSRGTYDLTGPAPVLTAPSTNDSLNVQGALALGGGKLSIVNDPGNVGAGSLGYYRAIQYNGTFTGTYNSTSIQIPAVNPADKITYTLDIARDPGYIDIHRGFQGDANDDGIVSFADFVDLSNNFGLADKGWIGGDFNGDGVTSFADFVLLSNNFGLTVGGTSLLSTDEIAAFHAETANFGASSVPEPTSLALLGLGAVALLKRKRKA